MTVVKKEQTIHTFSNNVPGNTGNVMKVFVSDGYWDKEKGSIPFVSTKAGSIPARLSRSGETGVWFESK
jgi:hypothetical protein